jgi:diadenosine tetraphosphate (Ap4A) HIT family hydrolase
MRKERFDETLETESERTYAFCEIDSELSSVLLESEHFYLTQDKFPVTPAHLLIIPKRHITSPSDLSETEWHDLRVVLEEACLLLKKGDIQITGFNVGINIGSDAGQTIPHLHVHVIPRRPKDIPESKCGVRMVNPAKADYRATD